MATCSPIETIKCARKSHCCAFCGCIDAGESYERWRCWDGGDAGTVRAHRFCRVFYVNRIDNSYDYEIDSDGFWEWMRYWQREVEADLELPKGVLNKCCSGTGGPCNNVPVWTFYGNEEDKRHYELCPICAEAPGFSVGWKRLAQPHNEMLARELDEWKRNAQKAAA